MHPQRPRLHDQLTAEIRNGLRTGRWKQWLPQERLLAEELNASRSSLRLALERLKNEGLLEARRGKGTRILSIPRAGRKAAAASPTVTLLTPGSLEDRRPLRSIQIDHLREQLHSAGVHLQIVESRSGYSQHPQKALADLVEHHSSDCWILRLSTLALQQWFQDSRIPAVLLGAAHAGIRLPFAEVDRLALYRHAAGTLLAAGHRRITLFIGESRQGGDVIGEAGFREAFSHSPGAAGEVIHHEESVEGLIRQLRRCLQPSSPPTALLIAQPTYYLTAFSWLLQNGWRIPRDISLMTPAYETHLSYLHPAPACYRVDPVAFTQKLLRPVLAILKGDRRVPQKNWIMPEYHPGGSLRLLKRQPMGSA